MAQSKHNNENDKMTTTMPHTIQQVTSNHGWPSSTMAMEWSWWSGYESFSGFNKAAAASMLLLVAAEAKDQYLSPEGGGKATALLSVSALSLWCGRG